MQHCLIIADYVTYMKTDALGNQLTEKLQLKVHKLETQIQGG